MRLPYKEVLATQRKEYVASTSYTIKQRLQTGHPCIRTRSQNCTGALKIIKKKLYQNLNVEKIKLGEKSNSEGVTTIDLRSQMAAFGRNWSGGPPSALQFGTVLLTSCFAASLPHALTSMVPFL